MKKWIYLLSVITTVLLLNTKAFAVFDDFIGADHWDDVAMTYATSSSLDDAHDGMQTVHGMANSLYNNMYVSNNGTGWGMWLAMSGGGGGTGNPSPTGFTGPAWISYNFGQSYLIKEMLIWNFNQSVGLNRGLKTVTILVSKDGIAWTTVFSGNLNKGTGLNMMPPTNTISINSEIQFVVINCTANFSFLETYYGLSEVRWNILHSNAVNPFPGNGVADVNMTTNLVWTPGAYVAKTQGHDVYFGDSYYDVLGASVSAPLGVYKGRQDANSYNPGVLQMAKTYYWRVDEANGVNLWKGNVWSFRTHNSILIDDFDGVDGINNWSAAGTGTLSSASTACGGPHSMKITYVNGYSPYYAGATRYYSSSNIDMKSNGIKSLRMQYRGASTNGTSHASIFVKLTDSAGREATVLNPDTNAALAADCTMWFVDLAKFTTAPNPTTFDLAHVSQVMIGVGDGQPPTSSASGEVLIDQVALYPVGCGVYPQGSNRPDGDLNNDCYVDFKDLREFARFWLVNNVFP
jgi:hypothetical protein